MVDVNISVWIPSMDTAACARKDTSWYHCLLTVEVNTPEESDGTRCCILHPVHLTDTILFQFPTFPVALLKLASSVVVT